MRSSILQRTSKSNIWTCIPSRHVTISLHTQRELRTMAHRKLKRPTKLVLDYDATLTVKDTMVVLGQLPKNPKKTWEEIVDAYMIDYTKYKETPYPWKNYDREEFSGWLAARKWVEQNSAQRVQDAEFFKGATTQDVVDAVKASFENGTLQLRPGWVDLFELFLPHYHPRRGFQGSAIEIISVNWSRTSISQALLQSASKQERPQKLLQYVQDLKIYANEIEGLDSVEGSSGVVVRPGQDIRTSGDKLRYLRASKAESDPSTYTVYVGDSTTDFDCLCAADLGIWLMDVPEAEYEQASRDTFKPLAFVPPPLKSISNPEEATAMFYWAPDFQTILVVLATT